MFSRFRRWDYPDPLAAADRWAVVSARRVPYPSRDRRLRSAYLGWCPAVPEKAAALPARLTGAATLPSRK